MSERFKPGEKVIAYYDAGRKTWSGWYKGTIVSLQPDGNYLIRWDPSRRDADRLPTSSVDPDEIRHRPERGPYSGGF